MTAQEAIAKIKAEIERRKKELQEAEADYRKDECEDCANMLTGGIGELQRILSFLDTLGESKGNEVKIGKSVSDFIVEGKEIVVPEPPIDNSPQFNLVVHKEESVCKELEEEYKQFVTNDPVYNKLVNSIVGKAIARHFANWQKEQMMKDDSLMIQTTEDWNAVLDTEFKAGQNDMKQQLMKDAISCNVFWYDGPKLSYTQEQQDVVLEKIGAHEGDEVKLIIIKENKK